MLPCQTARHTSQLHRMPAGCTGGWQALLGRPSGVQAPNEPKTRNLLRLSTQRAADGNMA